MGVHAVCGASCTSRSAGFPQLGSRGVMREWTTVLSLLEVALAIERLGTVRASKLQVAFVFHFVTYKKFGNELGRRTRTNSWVLFSTTKIQKGVDVIPKLHHWSHEGGEW